jgi:hypothetical protein
VDATVPPSFPTRPGRRAARVAALALALVVAVSLLAAGAGATPTTNFWAPSTPGIQAFGVLHLTYDTYFNQKATYPIDAGLTLGVLPGSKIQAEIGFDLFYPTFASSGPLEFPVQLNVKLGSPEGAFFNGSPAWGAGVYAVGFEKDVTDYNVLYGMVGKTFPVLGSLALGGYYGLHQDLLRSSSGHRERGGVMAGWFSPAIDVPVIDRIHFTWDVQTGENVLGATGGGIYLYVTPTVDVLTGPVFFFEEELQPGGSSWMWSLQLDVDFDLRRGSSD